jgi:hypothetical protein
MLLTLRTGRALLPRDIIFLLLVIISGLSKPQDLVCLEWLDELEKFTLSGLEPVTFWLVA